MKKKLIMTLLASVALGASAGASAGGVDLSIGLGLPAAPVYVAPQPVYVAPQPAVVAYPAYGGYWRGDEGDDDHERWEHYRKHWRKRHHHDDD
ncbi:hypothetical protein WS67_17005 [Burkholderia singularis]|uniref:Uncharacterized protein n=1 Tax=Burkholderia singularis TaxID=1503053 RepID=A0A118DN78_9BURK|nr:PXPV repeat protein [Burkholderia singularis]KVE26063.1 hypothetical protein WS67_17005 [Burkholderia singularis]